MTNGFIQLPRSIEQQAWYRRALDRTVAIHLLLNASFKALSHPIYGVLERGSYVTTYRQLAEDLGLKNSTCEKIINRLKADGFLCVKQLNRATQIVITWRDFTTLRDEGVLPDQSEACTNLRTKSCTNQTDVKYCNNESCEGEESRACTKSCTTSCTLKNNVIEESNIINTQEYYNPGITKNAPAREAHASASEQDERVTTLLNWMAERTPEVFRMEVPFTDEQLRWMCATYPLDRLKRVLTDCASKRGFDKHRFAFNAFDSYMRYDKQENSDTKMYTYEEVCDMVYKGKCKQEDFIFVNNNGASRWLKV